MAKAKSKFAVYLVMPKVMMHREDGLYQEQGDDEDEEDEEDEESEDIFDDEDESVITKYLRPVGLAFGLGRCPEDSIHPEQEFVDGNDAQAGDSGVFW